MCMHECIYVCMYVCICIIFSDTPLFAKKRVTRMLRTLRHNIHAPRMNSAILMDVRMSGSI